MQVSAAATSCGCSPAATASCGPSRISVLRDGRVQRSIALGDRDLATVSRWLDTGRTVLAATRAGLAELVGAAART
jgi:hypothetical protein